MSNEENFKKPYLLFMRDSSIPPEPGRSPRRTVTLEYFDELADAQSVAQAKRKHRDFVTVLKRITIGEFEEIEEYRYGQIQSNPANPMANNSPLDGQQNAK